MLGVIVDNANEATELQVLVPSIWNLAKLYLFGDDKQLEPDVFSETAKLKGYGRSAFKRLIDCLQSSGRIDLVKSLNKQYKIAPVISDCLNLQCYDGKLREESAQSSGNFPYKPIVLFNMAYGRESRSSSSGFVVLLDYIFTSI